MALSRALSLTRFITKGPVTKLSSTPYPNYWSRDVWHSIAQLPAEWFSGNKTLRFMSYAAGAWSKNKEESQIKALVEAGERWAFWYYSKNSPSAAGINIDASTNGFAALPSSMGIQKTMEIALCEAIERWLLNNIWNTSLVGLTPINYEAGIVKKIFPDASKKLFFFQTSLTSNNKELGINRVIYFILCILKTDQGGALAGSASSTSLESALERAFLEAYSHYLVFKKMSKKSTVPIEHLFEKRILKFASDKNGYDFVLNRLSAGEAFQKPSIPPIIFSSTLEGPWNPEILVHRVLIKDFGSILDGGENVFFI